MTDDEDKLLTEFCDKVADITEDDRDTVRLMMSLDLAWIQMGELFLSMNDTWGWASADCEDVPPGQLKDVVRLFRDFGRAGLLFWVSERRGRLRSEFHDVNRFIEFVRNEERIRREVPGHSALGYHKATYTIGQEP